jgi:uncharacterized protein (TIGR02271 family)
VLRLWRRFPAFRSHGERVQLREHDKRSSASDTAADTGVTVPVIEEQLQIRARACETERVRIDKTVTEHEVEVDEPLFAEDVQVERVRLDPPREVDAPPPVRTEGETTVVPVLEERLVVEKRLVVREELRITRVARRIRDPRRVVLRSERVSVARTAGDDAEGRGSNDASQANPSTSAMPKE